MSPQVFLILFVTLAVHQCTAYEVVFALNVGGRSFEDSAGIEYEEDTSRDGHKSNYGERYAISRVPAEDATLYQTERYSTKSFSYSVPLHGEGKYLLVLKFCEVFFEEANRKVFDVLLNEIPVVTDLDIFHLVGHATAHDEHIPFTVSRGKLFIRDSVSDVRSGRLKITFAKGPLDNPKINAIVLVKGVDVDEFPRLPPLPRPAMLKAKQSPSDTTANTKEPLEDMLDVDEPTDDEFLGATPITNEGERKERRTSGPKQPDPYAAGDNSLIMTVLFIVVATIIPIVILRRCRL